MAAVLIVGTAVSEIWLSLDSFGPWLFGIYGAAAAIALLGILAFYLAFVAELPPRRRSRSRPARRPSAADARRLPTRRPRRIPAAEETEETEAVEETAEADAKDTDAEEAEADSEEAAEDDKDEESAGTSLRNRRPSSKSGTKRRGWRSRGEVATED